MLTGTVGAGVDRGLRATPDVLAHPAVELVLRRLALRHVYRLNFSTRPGPSPDGRTISTAVHASPVWASAPEGGPGGGKGGCMTAGAAEVNRGRRLRKAWRDPCR